MLCKRCEKQKAVNDYCGDCRHELWKVDYVWMGLDRCQNNRADAARYLGIHIRTLRNYINSLPELKHLKFVKKDVGTLVTKKMVKPRPEWDRLAQEGREKTDRQRWDAFKKEKIDVLLASPSFRAMKENEQREVLDRYDKLYSWN